jgi:Lrp/AsnC family leucine-responsive transcriptional regulator
MIDDRDLKILSILQANARVSYADIARELGMAQSATLERVRKLEERGIIRGYGAIVDPAALDLTLLAFVFVRSAEPAHETNCADGIAQIPEVLEVHHIAGEDCYLAKVRVRDTEHLSQVLRDGFGRVHPTITTRTTIVLRTVKEQWSLPVAEAHGELASAKPVSEGVTR